MATLKKCEVPPDKLALFEKLLATNPKVERKGAATPYTSLNGHMFTFMNPEGKLALRLPDEDREKFLKEHRTKLFEAHGTILKEYVTVPDTLLKNTRVLAKYFQTSYEYLASLKPKPTKRK